MVSPLVNHVGLCVTDLDRSVRFYTEVLGFAEKRRAEIPDEGTDKLLRVAPPVGLTAVYLGNAGMTLELLHYARAGNPPAAPRVLNEPGLTHMSFCVEDMGATRRAVAAGGGTVLEETDMGSAVMVRDPDGQLIELLPMRLRPYFE